MEAHSLAGGRRRGRLRSVAYLTIAVGASGALIATSLTALDVRVLGFADWPIVAAGDARPQLLPDPARGETTARLQTRAGEPPALEIPGRGGPDADVIAAAAPAGTAPAVMVVDGAAPAGAGRFVTIAATTGEPPLTRRVDSDGDGLSDDLERLLGTDPLRSDTDGDGIPDAFEVEHGMDPRQRADARIDLDGDGISNRNEYLVRADPRIIDSNGDGIPDGDDDSDGDGLPNALEERLGLNPSSAVSQAGAAPPAPPSPPSRPAKGGGKPALVVPARSEAVAGTSRKPSVADGDRDSDGDGFSNAVELAAGTDPADPASRPEPVEEPPVEEPPVEEPPVEEPPVEEPPVEEPPVEEPPVEEPPVEEPPVEQPPVEEPPVEEPPVEEPPVEEPPVEQPPVEQPPAEQPPAPVEPAPDDGAVALPTEP